MSSASPFKKAWKITVWRDWLVAKNAFETTKNTNHDE
jgi:hypothetical protein